MSKTTSKIDLKFLKKGLFGVGILMLGILLPNTLSNIPASAIELYDKSISWKKAPRLVKATVNHNEPKVRAAYQFTIEVPLEAHKSIRSVKIAQKPNNEEINFDLDRTRVFESNSSTDTSEVSIVSVIGNKPVNSNEVEVVFASPLKPGSTVTIELIAKHNPLYGGVYLFDVIAFIEGKNNFSLNLGSARLHFNEAGD